MSEKNGRVVAFQLLAGTIFILAAFVAPKNLEESISIIAGGLALLAIAPALKYLP